VSPLQRRNRSEPTSEAIDDIGTRRTFFDRIVLIATISIFGAAIAELFDQFRSVSPSAVLAFLATMPKHQIGAAIGLTAASYLLLTGYDFLALRYVRRRLRFRDVVFASFTAFAFSNNLGFQLLSGGSMRYRIYSNLGLQGDEIFGIVAFCTFTYALGVMTVGGTVFVFEPAELASLLSLPRPVISAVGIALLSLIAAYLAVAAKWHGPIGFGRFRLQPPTLILAIAQLALASIDAVLAGTVFYVLLPVDFNLGFESYLGIYMIAATSSVLSLIPGGLGVFETAIMLMTVPPSKAAALGAFLAYRMIYFAIPFVVAIVCFLVHETRRMTEKS
jgi:uncharacterized membrane protein YbhN (UPF0104 family)